VNLEELSPQDREYICGQIHTLREMARILSPDFEKKLTVQVAKQGRALSRVQVGQKSLPSHRLSLAQPLDRSTWQLERFLCA